MNCDNVPDEIERIKYVFAAWEQRIPVRAYECKVLMTNALTKLKIEGSNPGCGGRPLQVGSKANCWHLTDQNSYPIPSLYLHMAQITLLSEK